jgi:hypothetical protein
MAQSVASQLEQKQINDLPGVAPARDKQGLVTFIGKQIALRRVGRVAIRNHAQSKGHPDAS